MQKLKTNIYLPIFLFLILNILFTRSFVGLGFFNHLLGEYIVLFGFIYLFFLVLYSSKTHRLFSLKIITAILIYYLLQLIFTQANITNTYTFKASSFIAMTSYFYLGLNLPRQNEYIQKIKQWLPLMLPIIYFLGSGLYPDFLTNFFIENSDKFQFIKASDVLMGVLIIVFYQTGFNEKRNDLYLFLIIPAFIPLLLYLSRGSFVAIVLFFVMELFTHRKQFISNLPRTFLLALVSMFIFVFSTFNIYGNLNFEKSNPLINEELDKRQTEVIQENLLDLIERRNTVGVVFSLYFEDNVLKSTDGTLNWRLDIWQDLLSDMNISNKNLFGYGYNEILSVMTDPSEPGRMGRDGMNENIHNYFLNIFARGGVILLILFVTLHITFVREWKSINGNYRLANFIIPLLVASFFDISMEGVQFPLNYYFFVGAFLSYKK
tara:strand:- start:974 stop:2275 length:1302 start_codon:yes stop_codon:yes gene_type:complete